MIGTLLWKYKGVITMAFLALGISTYIGYLKVQVSNRNETIAELGVELASVRATLDGEKAKTARLEKQLSDMVDEGKKKEANAKMWRQKFDASEKEVLARLGGLAAWLPTLKETDCDSAKRLLSDYRN